MGLKIKLGPKTQEASRKEAINDGGWILRKTDGSGQGDVPLVSYEAKWPNVNDTVRHTGQEESFQNESLAKS